MNKYILLVLLLILFGVGWNVIQHPKEEFTAGSVSVSNEYIATSTGETSGGTAPQILLKSGLSTLGQVTITGAATGEMYIYDATTTNNDLRISTATTSITRVHFPASTVAGTYVFDAQFNNGIFIETIGTAPTTTILYR